MGISVIMSVYNDSSKLEESINSILNQTYENFEFIICDDASNDTSWEILERFSILDQRIKLIRNIENLGLAASLNKCIHESKNEYIARMDADDISKKNRLQRQIDFMKENKDLAFCCTAFEIFDENGTWGKINHTEKLTAKSIFIFNPIAHPSVMMRKSIIKQVGGYTVSSLTKRGQDFDLWCKLFIKGHKAEFINEVLFSYREDKNGLKKRTLKSRMGIFRMKLYWHRKLELPKYYLIYAAKPLIAAFIPTIIMEKHRKKILA